jgi:hypothetical protein
VLCDLFEIVHEESDIEAIAEGLVNGFRAMGFKAKLVQNERKRREVMCVKWL